MRALAIAVFLAAVVAFGQNSAGSVETVSCVLSMPPDGGTGSTGSACLTDGGTPSACGPNCTNLKGANLLVQCDADVYLNQDGGVAATTDFKVDFSNNTDPYLVYLLPTQSRVSVLLVTTATGKTCKFAPTLRPKPR